MNEKILISYIIPAYNAADTLERAVESITHTWVFNYSCRYFFSILRFL